jgi:hypothetical protein
MCLDQLEGRLLLTSTTLAVAAASGTYGGTTNLLAHLTSGANNVSGEIIDFQLGGHELGTATTDSNGLAFINNVSLTGATSFNVGTFTNAVTAEFTGDSGAGFTGSSGASNLTVTTAPLTITANNQSKLYGAALPTLTASYTGFVNGDTSASLSTQPTITTTATAASHVASSPYAITASGAVDTNYSISYVAGSMAVTTAPLTITANNQSKVYGAALPTLTASYTGFVNGDTSSNLTTLPTITTTATAASHVAGSPYAINLSGAVDTNYTISYVAGNLAVTTAPLTITANDQSKVYGQLNPTFTVSYTGFVNGDTSSSLTTAPSVGAFAGQYATVETYPIEAIGAVDTDYSFTYVNGTLTVTPAPLAILIDNASKVYGQANPTFTGTITGILSTDQVGATYTSPATQYSDVQQGGYPITFVTLTGPQAVDYSTTIQGASVTNGVLTVTPAPLTVLVANHTKTYGQPNPIATGVFTGALNGDQITLTYTNSATQYSDVINGAYAIIPTAINGFKAGDYSYTVEGSSVTQGFLTVTPAPIAVVVSNQTKVYGQANPTLTGTVAGVLNNDDVSVNYSTAATAFSDVQPGGYPIYATSLSGTKAVDYSFGQIIPGSLSITPAPLVVSGNIQAKTYGQPNPNFTVSYGGFVLGQDPSALSGSLQFSTTATTASHAGAYFVTPSGLSSNDYAISYVNGGLAVNKAKLAIVAPSPTMVYGQAVPTLTPWYYGFVNGDTPASLASRATATTTASQASHVGSYPTVASGAASADYTFSYSPGSLGVTPATLTVTPNGVFKPYGAPLPGLTAAYSGFVNGDTPASLTSPVTLTTTANALSTPGFYPIIAHGGTSADYNVIDGYNFVDVLALNAGQVAFVKSLYSDILGRAPEATGIYGWITALNQGATRASVTAAIYNSNEAVTYRAHHRGHTVSQAVALSNAQKAQAQAGN